MPDQGFIYRDFIARACKYLADILHIHFAELLGSLVGCIVASRYGLEHLARSLQSSQDGQHDTGIQQHRLGGRLLAVTFNTLGYLGI